MSPIASISVSILALGILVILHEAGHYWVARLSGMNVRRFSIGFGPAIARFSRRRSDGAATEFRIGAVPLGGYVQIEGMSPEDGSDPTSPGNYMRKSSARRFATILAGPLANYLLGLGLVAVFYAFFFFDALAPIRVVRVLPDSPASRAGLEAGDLILGTRDAAFDLDSDFRSAIQESGGGPIELRLRRDAEERIVRLTPEAAPGEGYRIGIGLEPSGRRPHPLGVFRGFEAALTHVADVSAGMLIGLSRLVRAGSCDGVEVSGPIGMVEVLSETVESSGSEALATVANISIMLGLLNLLPIPSLDGSRLLFLLLGLIRRRPIEPRVEAAIHAVGLALLLALLVVVSIADVAR